MPRARLMDRPDGYSRLHVSTDSVEVWEEGRRSRTAPGSWEWWYFDGILDDGTSVVVQFFIKSLHTVDDAEDHPTATIRLTLPDGTRPHREAEYSVEESHLATDRCDVGVGPHRFEGDLHDYHIVVDPIDGVGADLTVTSRATPFRPGTACFGFGDHDEEEFTWLSAVPKADVTGTLVVDGRSRPVHGRGYHDHQWGTTSYLTLWNHWLWARQGFEDYTILVFDMVTSAPYGFQRFPICFVQDAEGRIVHQRPTT